MKITKEEYFSLDLEGRSAIARALTQKEWDQLFPPQSYPEPSDASGWTEDVSVMLIE